MKKNDNEQSTRKGGWSERAARCRDNRETKEKEEVCIKDVCMRYEGDKKV